MHPPVLQTEKNSASGQRSVSVPRSFTPEAYGLKELTTTKYIIYGDGRSVRYRKERRGNHQHVRRRKERPQSEKFRGRAAGGDQSGKEILSWLQIIVAAVVIAFVLNNFVIANSRIPTGSMENTIMSHSRVIGSRLSYIKDDPERGDIVIFRYPDNEKVYYVKRVIGLPGETVEVKDGKVYINGSDTPLDEPYLPEPMEGSYGPYEVRRAVIS